MCGEPRERLFSRAADANEKGVPTGTLHDASDPRDVASCVFKQDQVHHGVSLVVLPECVFERSSEVLHGQNAVVRSLSSQAWKKVRVGLTIK